MTAADDVGVLSGGVEHRPPERHAPERLEQGGDPEQRSLGPRTLCVVTARDWTNALRALGREDLLDEPRFAPSLVSRREHREEIDALVGEWVARHTVAEVVETFQAHQVAAGPVRTVPELLEDEHLRERGMVVDLPHPTGGPVPGASAPGMPIRFRRHPAGFDRPAPVLGAHNDEIYGGWLGVDRKTLEDLRADGVI